MEKPVQNLIIKDGKKVSGEIDFYYKSKNDKHIHIAEVKTTLGVKDILNMENKIDALTKTGYLNEKQTISIEFVVSRKIQSDAFSLSKNSGIGVSKINQVA